MVKRISGVDFRVVEAGRRPGDPAMLVARGERIKAVLGWKPFHDDLEKIVTDAWNWERTLHGR
jgi:UDP-glucose 4-epimerase